MPLISSDGDRPLSAGELFAARELEAAARVVAAVNGGWAESLARAALAGDEDD